MSSVRGFIYTITVFDAPDDLAVRIEAVLASSEVDVERPGKTKGKRAVVEVNIRPMINELHLESQENGEAVIRFETGMVDGKLAKPKDVLSCLGLDAMKARVFKRETMLEK